uniref:(northern house mosquito) hypothetical protein n=1 Tax=Culex pipiens TaxID=7175 RepID=A0A8D8AS96_CULPI
MHWDTCVCATCILFADSVIGFLFILMLLIRGFITNDFELNTCRRNVTICANLEKKSKNGARVRNLLFGLFLLSVQHSSAAVTCARYFGVFFFSPKSCFINYHATPIIQIKLKSHDIFLILITFLLHCSKKEMDFC